MDSNQIPIGMKMYPGNESEKPVFRDIIDSLKKQNNITGRTIHVADKGLTVSRILPFQKQMVTDTCFQNLSKDSLKGESVGFA